MNPTPLDPVPNQLTVSLSALEPSAEHIAISLKKALQRAAVKKGLSLRFIGIGSKALKDAGVPLQLDYQTLGAQGIRGLIKLLFARFGLMPKLAKALQADALITLDAYYFHKLLTAKVRALQPKTYIAHAVSPTIWSYAPHRANDLGASLNAMLCLFPFELETYQNLGLSAYRMPFYATWGLKPISYQEARANLALLDRPTLGFFLGSRNSEFVSGLKLISQALPIIQAALPDYQLLLHLKEPAWLEKAKQALQGLDIIYQTGFESVHDSLSACEVAVIKAGTLLMESAALNRPYVSFVQRPRWQFSLFSRLYYKRGFCPQSLIFDLPSLVLRGKQGHPWPLPLKRPNQETITVAPSLFFPSADRLAHEAIALCQDKEAQKRQQAHFQTLESYLALESEKENELGERLLDEILKQRL